MSTTADLLALLNQQANPPVVPWYQNRNFWSGIAGLGAAIDPTGVGGNLGKAAQAQISSQAAQERAGQQAKIQNATTKLLLETLNQQGGLTPKETPGVTSATATPEGVKLEITPHPDTSSTTPIAPAPAPADTPATPLTPTSSVAPTTEEYNRRIALLRPFFSTFLGQALVG